MGLSAFGHQRCTCSGPQLGQLARLAGLHAYAFGFLCLVQEFAPAIYNPAIVRVECVQHWLACMQGSQQARAVADRCWHRAPARLFKDVGFQRALRFSDSMSPAPHGFVCGVARELGWLVETAHRWQAPSGEVWAMAPGSPASDRTMAPMFADGVISCIAGPLGHCTEPPIGHQHSRPVWL